MMAIEKGNANEDRNWMRLAEERGRALAEVEERRLAAEKACQAWMQTAQLAEEWADQLGKVRQWLQEQLQAQGEELNETQQQNEQLLAEKAALQEQCETAKKALLQKHEALHELEQSPGFRIVRWMRRQLIPPQTLRGRLVAKSLNATFRLLRRSA